MIRGWLRWWLAIALLLSVGLNLGILGVVVVRQLRRPAPAGPRPEAALPANADPVPRLARLADRLGLEGEPRRKFLDIQWNLYQETSRQRLQLNEVHRELRREMTRKAPDRQRVESLLEESSRLYLSLERSLVGSIFATRDLLGPDKEEDYLRIVGRLRVPNPGPGIADPTGPLPQPPRRPTGALDRLRQRRLERLEQRRGGGAEP